MCITKVLSTNLKHKTLMCQWREYVCEISLTEPCVIVLLKTSSMSMNQQYVLNTICLNRNTHNKSDVLKVRVK